MGDALRVWFGQPRRRVGHHPGAAHGLAVHTGRVRRWPDNDRALGRDLSNLPAPTPAGRGPNTGGARYWRVYGGARSNGHVDRGDGLVLAGPVVKERLHLGLAHFRDGVGGGTPRHRPWVAHRRSNRRLGTGQLLAA